jgi:Glyoxalase/Bleomycin resistance protein/Dioxygenase superfamily
MDSTDATDTTARLSPYYHVGIIVTDVAAARVTLTEQLGVEWGPIMHLDAIELRNGAGDDVSLPNTLCYSVDAPHLELIEEVPGSVWVRNEHSNLHHIGMWSGDLPADSARIAGMGCPLQLCGRAGDAAPVSFAYHGHELGIRIELLDAGLQEAMSFLFSPEAG